MKEILFEFKKEVWKMSPNKKELRQFGLVVGGILFLLAGYLYFQRPDFWKLVLGVIGSGLILSGLFVPWLLKWPHKFWLSLGFVLGFVISHIILVALFYLAVTPIAILKRLVSSKSKKDSKSYWVAHPDIDWSKAMEEMS